MDPSVNIIGYQVDPRELKTGIFLFNHTCGSTLGLAAESFKDLYSGPMYSEKLTGSETCPGYCLHKDNLEVCPQKCECAYVRDIIQLLK